LAEAATANIAVILNGKEFITPPTEGIIAGTVLKRTLKFIEEELIPKGTISKVTLRQIPLNEAIKGEEIILLGGDKIIPVTHVDD